MKSKNRAKFSSKPKGFELKSVAAIEGECHAAAAPANVQSSKNISSNFDPNDLVRARFAAKNHPDQAASILKYGAQLLLKGDVDHAFEEAEKAYKLNSRDGTACLMWLKSGLLSGKPVTEQSSWLPLIDSDEEVKQIAANVLERTSAAGGIGLAYFAWASSPSQIEYLLWASQSGEVSYDVQADAHCSTTGLLRVRPGLSRFHKPAPAHDCALKILIGNVPPINKDVFVPVDMAEVEVAARARQANMALKQDQEVDVVFDTTVDVIIPAYRDARMTVECIQSVLAAKSNTRVHLIVIDDASPEPELSEALRRIAAMGKIQLIVNRRNLGFVGSVNLGMSLHPSRHPVLLNSDTLVYDGWIDELMAGLRARRRVGSVTSLATSATICSYPEVLDSNKKFEVCEHEKTAALARRLDSTVYEIPTAVGNCMLINRAALNDVGLFDDEIFAKGYGEENDFSRRCVQRGWANVCAPKCFTTHFGEVSFGGAVRGPRVEQAAKKINLLHPEYNKAVHDYIAHDPLSKVRRDLDIARIAGEVCGSVFITHGIGGGIETYVDRKKTINNTWVLTGYRDGRTTLAPGLAPHRFPNLQFGAHERDLLVAALRRLNPARFEVQSLVSMPWQISSVIDEVGKPHGVIAHDFAMYCHQVSCMDRGEYCGNEDANLDRCIGCLSRNESVVDFPKAWNLAQWRKDAELLVKNADYVIAPSEDTASRYRRVFGIKVDVKRHTDDKYRAAELAPLKDGERLRIAVIGAIGPHKGYHPVLEMTEIAHAKQAPVDFYVVGYTMDNPRLLKHGNAFITGAYKDEAEARWLLSSINPHVVLYMPKFPETWCYTLDIIRSAGLFVVSHDLGALGERLRGKPGSKVLPMNTSAFDTLQAIFGLWGRSVDAGQEVLAIAA